MRYKDNETRNPNYTTIILYTNIDYYVVGFYDIEVMDRHWDKGELAPSCD